MQENRCEGEEACTSRGFEPNGRKRRRMIGLLACLVVASGVAACRTGSKANEKDAAASAHGQPPSPAADTELSEQLRRIAAVCEVDVEQSLVACDDGAQRKLAEEYRADRRSRARAVGALARALGDRTPGMPTVAVNLLYSEAFRTTWGDAAPGSVHAADADALLKGVLALPPKQIEQALPAAVHAEMLARQSANLYAALEKSANARLLAIAANHLMTHGRLSAFPEVQKLVQEGDAEQASAALASPLGMQAWTSSERSALCPWSGNWVSDARPGVATAAAAIASRCGGEAVDRLLSAREGESAHGKFTADSLSDLRGLCSEARRRQPLPPSVEQCQRTRKLLEAVEENQAFDITLRNGALIALGYQFPDARTLALARTIEKGPPGVLVATAQRIIRRQTRSTAPDSNPTQLPVAFKPTSND